MSRYRSASPGQPARRRAAAKRKHPGFLATGRRSARMAFTQMLLIRRPTPPSPSSTRLCSSSPHTASGFALCCRQWLKPIQTVPTSRGRCRSNTAVPGLTSRTNERTFIQTALRVNCPKHWTESDERDKHLKPWTDYNHQRPHGGLSCKPPISRSDDGTAS